MYHLNQCHQTATRIRLRIVFRCTLTKKVGVCMILNIPSQQTGRPAKWEAGKQQNIKLYKITFQSISYPTNIIIHHPTMIITVKFLTHHQQIKMSLQHNQKDEVTQITARNIIHRYPYIKNETKMPAHEILKEIILKFCYYKTKRTAQTAPKNPKEIL